MARPAWRRSAEVEAQSANCASIQMAAAMQKPATAMSSEASGRRTGESPGALRRMRSAIAASTPT